MMAGKRIPVFDIASKAWEFRDWIWYAITVAIALYATVKSWVDGLPIYLVIPLGLFTAGACLWIAFGVALAPSILLPSRRRARELRAFVVEGSRLLERVQESKAVQGVQEEKAALKDDIKSYRAWRKSVLAWLTANLPEKHSAFAVLQEQRPILPHPTEKGKLKVSLIMVLHTHIEFLGNIVGSRKR